MTSSAENQPIYNPEEILDDNLVEDYSGGRHPNQKFAVIMSAIALAGGLAGEARAHSDRAGGAEAIEAVELDPVVRAKKDILEGLKSGRIPNKVLNLAITFSVKKGDKEFYYGPSNRKQGDSLLDVNNQAPRVFWFGQYPRYVHTKGEDWLIFDHTMGRKSQIHYNHEEGPAMDMGYTFFMKASDMPDDTRIFSFSRGPIPPGKRVLPARIDKNNFIRVKGLPVEAPETMISFNSRNEINDGVKRLGLVPSRIRSLENLK